MLLQNCKQTLIFYFLWLICFVEKVTRAEQIYSSCVKIPKYVNVVVELFCVPSIQLTQFSLVE